MIVNRHKIRISKSLEITAIFMALIVMSSCIIINASIVPTCLVDQQISSSYGNAQNLGLYTIVDYAPRYCVEELGGFVQNFTIAGRWDNHFCLGQTAVRTHFLDDGWGCGDHGGLIVYGPSLEVYFR